VNVPRWLEGEITRGIIIREPTRSRRKGAVALKHCLIEALSLPSEKKAGKKSYGEQDREGQVKA